MRHLIRLLVISFAGLQPLLLSSAEETKEQPPKLEAKTVVTEHQITIQGKPVKYKATAGTMILKDDKGKPEASIFYIAYTKDGVQDLGKRPLTFCFNGGPGSSSVWLHLGLLGPKRVAMSMNGIPERPYRLVDNEYSLLDKTDLIFIDPVSTGYSKVADGVDEKKFHNVDDDIRSVAEFIRLYTTTNNRWASPKFVAGESYGTIRATGLSNYLFEKNRMELNGIMLISSVLDFQAYLTSAGNDLPFITFLPTYSATAWYHKKLDKSLPSDFFALIKEVETFASNDYALALLKGSSISEGEKKAVAERLARFTGLDIDLILQSNLRIKPFQFMKELLNDEDRIVSRFDGRITGIDQDPTSSRYAYDPMISALMPAFTAMMNQYLYDNLNWKVEQEYEILSEVWPWEWCRAKNQFLNMNEDLLELMTQNPHFRVYVGSGFFDLATPFSAADYTFNHLPIDPILRGNITMKYYDAGHMMYIHRPSLAKMKKDLDSFIDAGL